MKATKVKAAKIARRARRQAKGHRHYDDVEITPLGGEMDPELLRRIRGAAARFDPTRPWSDLAPTVLPVIKRRFQPSPLGLEPLHVQVPPGIPTGFGLDFGPAFAHVTADQVEAWGIGRAELLATALENLRRLIDIEPPRIERFASDGVPIVAVQGQGWGSSLLLLPEILSPILGSDPLLLLAPVRNTLLAVPETADAEFVETLWMAVAEGAHDELDVPPLRWTGRAVVAMQARTVGLPN
jgi:hypothetical protein